MGTNKTKHVWAAHLACLVLLMATGGADAQLPGDKKVFVPPYGERGCWVLLFAGKEFDPPMVKLNGPTFIERFEDEPVVIPELKPVGGPVFLRSIQSAIIGPRARLEGYEQPDYDNRSITLEPGQQVADLIDLRFHERVKSLQVNCVQDPAKGR